MPAEVGMVFETLMRLTHAARQGQTQLEAVRAFEAAEYERLERLSFGDAR